MSRAASVPAAGAAISPPARPSGTLKLAWRFALREMRGGVRGFVIFLLCLTLGVASIAAVNSVSEMMTSGIEREGRTILGGDMRFGLNGREASEAEKSFLARFGTLAETANLRSMARLPDGTNQTLSEVKAVDGQYPLYGAVETDPAAPLGDLLAERNGRFGAVAAPEFFDRLGIEPGATVLLGGIEVELRGRLTREPDVLSDGFIFAPRLLISGEALRASGLIQPGSLVEYDYKLRFADPALDPAGIEAQAKAEFPQAGWSIRDAREAAPSLQRSIDRFSQFLTLVGLTALIVGGVGIANAVSAYLDGKRTVIATFKSLGAGGGFVVWIYIIQIGLLASLGIAAGLVLGALAPFAAAGFLEAYIPVSTHPSVYPGALLLATAFGYLTAFAFAILPLGRTRDIAATALFRSNEGPGALRTRLSYALTAGALALGIAGLAFVMAGDKRIASVFLVATAVAFVVLRLVSVAIRTLAARLPRVRSTPLRLAIGNIHRPGALTHSVVLSLGLGLTLLVTLATIDNALRREIGTSIAARAPNFFFVDIQSAEIDPFRGRIAELAPGSSLDAVPMLRGRIVKLNGTDVSQLQVPPEGAWVLRGDRGVTYAAAPPENTTVTQGQWWAADYAGEPLVSFSAKEGGELGLKLGDTISVNVLGREITARIANFRAVEWESMSINFVMVFSPNTFAGAPHAWLATLQMPNATSEGERAVLRGISNSFPAVTTVRVKDALDAVNALVAQLALAIRAAAAVALVSSVLVLSGALAAGNRTRVHDAVVLKTLGATRGTLIRAYVTEYMTLGAATALFAIGAGALAAWYVLARVMRLPFAFDGGVALGVLAVALVLTVGFGLAGTWRVLGQKAAPVLREL